MRNEEYGNEPFVDWRDLFGTQELVEVYDHIERGEDPERQFLKKRLSQVQELHNEEEEQQTFDNAEPDAEERDNEDFESGGEDSEIDNLDPQLLSMLVYPTEPKKDEKRLPKHTPLSRSVEIAHKLKAGEHAVAKTEKETAGRSTVLKKYH